MVISGHIPDLQPGNIDHFHNGHNLKNISLKIKKKNLLSTLVYLSRTPYNFLHVDFLLAGQEAKTRPAAGLVWSDL